MIDSIISSSIKNKLLVSLFIALAFALSLYSLKHLKLDALPDLSLPQVVLQVDFPNQSPKVVEEQVTYPLISSLMSISNVEVVRGASSYESALIYVIFKDKTDLYWARSRILEILSQSTNLPANAKVSLGSDSTSVGWAYQYALKSDTKDLGELRSLQDFYYKYALLGIDGVSEVASIGGFVKNFEITIDNDKLVRYNIDYNDIIESIKSANNESGGGVIFEEGFEKIIRTNGYVKDIKDIENIIIRNENNIIVRIGDVADVRLVPSPRRGAAELNGSGEVVGGIVMVKYEGNTYATLQKIKEKIAQLNASNSDVKIESVYDRSDLIQKAIKNLANTLLEESIIVLVISIVFLLHVRSALIIIITLPLCVFISLLLMRIFNIESTIMSLGGIAIAIGAMVDAAIVMIENAHKNLSKALHGLDSDFRGEIDSNGSVKSDYSLNAKNNDALKDSSHSFRMTDSSVTSCNDDTLKDSSASLANDVNTSQNNTNSHNDIKSQDATSVMLSGSETSFQNLDSQNTQKDSSLDTQNNINPSHNDAKNQADMESKSLQSQPTQEEREKDSSSAVFGLQDTRGEHSTPPISEKSGGFFGARGSGVGEQPFFAPKEENLKQGENKEIERDSKDSSHSFRMTDSSVTSCNDDTLKDSSASLANDKSSVMLSGSETSLDLAQNQDSKENTESKKEQNQDSKDSSGLSSQNDENASHNDAKSQNNKNNQNNTTTQNNNTTNQNTESIRQKIIIDSAKQVGSPIFFALMIIVVSFLPIFALSGQEEKLFSPLAFTKTFAMLVGAILSITIVPILMLFLIKGKIIAEEKNVINKFFIKYYRICLDFCLRFKYIFLALCLISLSLVYISYRNLGWEFMPKINEGIIMYMPVTPASPNMQTALHYLKEVDSILQSFDFVESVFGKVGRANTSSDPAPLSMLEVYVHLKNGYENIQEIRDKLDSALQIKGLTNSWTYPIRGRTDMLLTGIRTPLGIKLYGNDRKILESISLQIEKKLREMSETKSAFAQRANSGYYVDINIDDEKLIRYGVKKDSILNLINYGLGGSSISTQISGIENYPISARLKDVSRNDIESIKNIYIKTALGFYPLSVLADISYSNSPTELQSENGLGVNYIYITPNDNVSPKTYKERASEILKDIEMPNGYYYEFSGESEYLQSAMERLVYIVPFSLVLIFVLIYLALRRLSYTILCFITLPFALMGGLFALEVFGYNLSIASVVGILALLGIAAETSIVMIIYLEQSFREARASGKILNDIRLKEVVMIGAAQRVRPKLMTIISIIASFLPIMYSHGVGSEIMKAIAMPMLWGMITSGILTLFIIPICFYILKMRE